MKTATIRKHLLSALAASAVMVAGPALAQNVSFSIGVGSPGYSQPYGYDRGYGYGHGYDRRYGRDRGYGRDLRTRAHRLERTIERLAYDGSISRREARSLRWQMREYRNAEWRYERNGLTRWEYAELSHRLDHIEAQVRYHRVRW